MKVTDVLFFKYFNFIENYDFQTYAKNSKEQLAKRNA